MSGTLIGVVGVMTVVASVFVKFIGLPDQFRKNYKRKSTHGLSTAFIATSVIAYSLWTIYGLLKKDWVVVLGQGAGVITTGAVLYQIWLYRSEEE
jgi:MtN3 and saliva related transmembrane protein